MRSIHFKSLWRVRIILIGMSVKGGVLTFSVSLVSRSTLELETVCRSTMYNNTIVYGGLEKVAGKSLYRPCKGPCEAM